MISPNRPFVLLPQDREIMEITGLDEAEYREFVQHCNNACEFRPGEPLALTGFELFLVNLAIGLLLTGASYLLTPKPKNEERPEIEGSTVEGQDVVRRDRFTAKSGFDSIQNTVDLGSIIPIIYAKRNGNFGGVRINTNLGWSQMLSIGGGQFFKGLFFIGEGSNTLKINVEQTALGNNTLSSYDLREGVQAGRLSLYQSTTGGRLKNTNYVGGVVPENDIGAKGVQRDIYSINQEPDFCEVVLPSNQKAFGLYGIVGNNLGYKIGEDFTPLSQWQQGDDDFQRQSSNEAIAERMRQSIIWTTRAGFIGEDGEIPQGFEVNAKVGEVFTYKIYKDFQDITLREADASAGGEPAAELSIVQVNTAIASKQRSYDENINVGNLYRIGSAIAICIKRNDPFISDIESDDDGHTVTAEFQIVEPGIVVLWPEIILNTQFDDYEAKNSDPKGIRAQQNFGVIGSLWAQAFQIAIGAFSVERPAKIVEVGLRSRLQVRSSGIVNFNSLEAGYSINGFKVPDTSYQAYVDAEFCSGLTNGTTLPKNADGYRKEVKAGKYSATDYRYSFFRIYIRFINQTDFTELNHLYGVRSASGVDVYNFLRFSFSEDTRCEFKFVPVSAWEIRNDIAKGDLYVCDPHIEKTFKVDEANVVVTGNGERVERTVENFEIRAFAAFDGQAGMAALDDTGEENYVDGWAKLSEAFIYDEVVSSVNTSPEHEISYVNLISTNENIPKYNNLALLGLNINSSTEIRTLNQLSVYVERGVIDSSLFPDILFDLLTNKRYGVGDVFSEEQIDKKSFKEAKKYSKKLGHAFDGAIASRINIRTWASQIAQYFLLDLSISGGKFTLTPALFHEPVPISALFTSGNIIENSYVMSYLPVQDRTDPIVSVKWREERLSGSAYTKGLFPLIREFTVRMKGTPDSAPIIQLDLSNFCTNPRHAADAAYFECLKRRYITHAVQFKTIPSEANITAGSFIKIGMETVQYEQPRNGAITEDGTVTSWPELSDDTYDVLVWDGKTLEETKLKVRNGKTRQYSGVVFCLKNTRQTAETYKVQSLSFDDDGNVDITAVNWCVTDEGVSCCAEDFKDSMFNVDGIVLPPVDTDPAPDPQPGPPPIPEPTPDPDPDPDPDPLDDPCTVILPNPRALETADGGGHAMQIIEFDFKDKCKFVRFECWVNFKASWKDPCDGSPSVPTDEPFERFCFWQNSSIKKIRVELFYLNGLTDCDSDDTFTETLPVYRITAQSCDDGEEVPGSESSYEAEITWGKSDAAQQKQYWTTSVRLQIGDPLDPKLFVYPQPVPNGEPPDDYIPSETDRPLCEPDPDPPTPQPPPGPQDPVPGAGDWTPDGWVIPDNGGFPPQPDCEFRPDNPEGGWPFPLPETRVDPPYFVGNGGVGVFVGDCASFDLFDFKVSVTWNFMEIGDIVKSPCPGVDWPWPLPITGETKYSGIGINRFESEYAIRVIQNAGVNTSVCPQVDARDFSCLYVQAPKKEFDESGFLIGFDGWETIGGVGINAVYCPAPGLFCKYPPLSDGYPQSWAPPGNGTWYFYGSGGFSGEQWSFFPSYTVEKTYSDIRRDKIRPGTKLILPD